jgi:hypothetical protein
MPGREAGTGAYQQAVDSGHSKVFASAAYELAAMLDKAGDTAGAVPLGWDVVHVSEARHGITLPEPYRMFVYESYLGPPDFGLPDWGETTRVRRTCWCGGLNGRCPLERRKKSPSMWLRRCSAT